MTPLTNAELDELERLVGLVRRHLSQGTHLHLPCDSDNDCPPCRLRRLLLALPSLLASARESAQLRERVAAAETNARAFAKAADTEKGEARHWRERAEVAERERDALIAGMHCKDTLIDTEAGARKLAEAERDRLAERTKEAEARVEALQVALRQILSILDRCHTGGSHACEAEFLMREALTGRTSTSTDRYTLGLDVIDGVETFVVMRRDDVGCFHVLAEGKWPCKTVKPGALAGPTAAPPTAPEEWCTDPPSEPGLHEERKECDEERRLLTIERDGREQAAKAARERAEAAEAQVRVLLKVEAECARLRASLATAEAEREECHAELDKYCDRGSRLFSRVRSIVATFASVQAERDRLETALATVTAERDRLAAAAPPKEKP